VEQRQERRQPECSKGVEEDKMSEGDSSTDEGGEDSDEEMAEAMEEYAAARDTVLATAKQELGEIVR